MKANLQIWTAACVIAIALGKPAAAGPLEDGRDSYREKEYAKAAQLWRPLAESGDATAQYFLGSLFAEGKGVPQNDATAFQWFLRAANQGNADAQYDVGASFAAGTGVNQSDAQAAKWFRRAADQGMVFAQLNLGLLYAAGKGVPRDSVEAFKWLKIAFGGLPAGGPRMDVARAMQDVATNMTRDQLDEAEVRARRWAARSEAK